MEGFFSKKQTQSKSRPDGKVYSCVSCGLHKGANCPKMKPFGNFEKGILNIGEAPGKFEDQKGKQWQGKTGRLLQKAYKDLGIDLFNDCLNINAVNCKTPDNRTPTNYEIDCCRAKMIEKIIKDYQPKMIILLGGSALYSFLGKRWKKDLRGINRWRGFIIPDQNYKCWVAPVFHPSFVERSEDEVMTVWKNDLKEVFQKIEEPFPQYKQPVIKLISDLTKLDRIKSDMIVFDYETTGLKPHAKGHRIVCCSVAVSKNFVYVFMMPSKKEERKPFLKLLKDPSITKMGHNIKYEDTWSEVRLKTKVEAWDWDGMLAAHVLDNRKYITGLKFQVYINFGIIDYSSEIEPYLKCESNELNKIYKLLEKGKGKEELLTYCALDSIFEYRLCLKQMKIMNYSYLPF